MNPSADRYGNPAVWAYLEGTAGEPSTYSYLPVFDASTYDVDGLQSWRADGSDEIPTIGINSTDHDLTAHFGDGEVTWPAGEAFMHPRETTEASVVGWTSPVARTVHIRGQLHLGARPNCGNGVVWTLWQGAAQLRGGMITGHGHAKFSTSVQTVIGDQLFFTIDAGGAHQYFCDTTIVGLHLTATRRHRS